MRQITLINNDWKFTKSCTPENAVFEDVNLPHTWNAVDGQDGGNDYYRGTCWYKKEFNNPASNNQEVYVEFQGAAMTAEVYINGHHVAKHQGGYSTFRANITEYLQAENILEVSVNNGSNREVYPQKADFTFYGGIYRDVNLIVVDKTHFDLSYFGGHGIKVTPIINGKNATIEFEAWVCNAPNDTEVTFKVVGADSVTTLVKDGYAKASLEINDVHLWNGLDDPYLYTACASLSNDEVSVNFGVREMKADPEKGFFLNGRSYPLVGAARHQDRQGVGSALTRAMHEEDIKIMLEMGCNTVRLAHYQHDQYFYELCDKAGLVVWAEIPYISEHLPEANANTISQMSELVTQNYHHASVYCWCLSNEITSTGGVSQDMTDNHRVLNDLCHKLDKTRPTTAAHVFMLDTSEECVGIPDIMSYNLYYGWYIGEKEDNDTFFDKFHSEYPNRVIGLSEYGADANPAYQSGKPEKGDWTESYQAVYHEHMLKMWSTRPFIWAMHVWNMFDFGADGRNEGGKPGQNQKGLVTFDRKLKKDAFYIYKAYCSKEEFVHLCGSRYVDRHEDITEVKVYSNLDEVTLIVDGEIFETQTGTKVYKFNVPISSEHEIIAKSGNYTDIMKIRKVEKPNMDYINGGESVINWFDLDLKEGYYSIKDSMGELKANPLTAQILMPLMARAAESYGDVAKNVQIPEEMQKMMDMAPLESMLKQAGKAITKEMIIGLNNALNQIKK